MAFLKKLFGKKPTIKSAGTTSMTQNIAPAPVTAAPAATMSATTADAGGKSDLYRVVFVSAAADKTEYPSEAEARAALDRLNAQIDGLLAEDENASITFRKHFRRGYRRVLPDGTLSGGDRVPFKEVSEYIEHFSGDKIALKKRLKWPADNPGGNPGSNS